MSRDYNSIRDEYKKVAERVGLDSDRGVKLVNRQLKKK